MTTPTVTLSSTTVTGLTECPVTLTMSFANGNAYGVVITHVHGICSSPVNASVNFEDINTATSSLAGSGDQPTPLTLAASASTVYIPVRCTFHKAGAYTCNLVASGYRTDTGVKIQWPGAVAATVTITAVA